MSGKVKFKKLWTQKQMFRFTDSHRDIQSLEV